MLAPEFLLQLINFVKDSCQSVNHSLVVPHPNVTLFKSSFIIIIIIIINCGTFSQSFRAGVVETWIFDAEDCNISVLISPILLVL